MADKKSFLLDFLLDYTLGGCAGAATKTLLAPLERVIFALRVQDADPKVASGEVARHDGLVACFRALLKEQGAATFWRGNFLNCVRYFPTQAFNLVTKDQFKKLFPKYNPKTEWPKFFTANLLTGGFAATCSMMVFWPFDQYRQHLYIAADCGLAPPTSFLAYCSDKVRGGDVGAIFAGVGPSVLGILVYRGLQLACFDKIVNLNPYKGEQSWRGTLSAFACSQLAVQIGAAVTYPFDTVRRRLQIEAALGAAADRSHGTVDCLRRIVARDGVQGLYWGFGYNLLRSQINAVVAQYYGQWSRHVISTQGRDGKVQILGGVATAVLVGALFSGV